MKKIDTLEEFEKAVLSHDLTYGYSDDSRAYGLGRDSLARITEAAKKFDPADVERIWNAAVDKKVIESARSSFYWKADDTSA